MFRRKNLSSEENSFSIDQNNVKTKINQNLAHTIKELHKEYQISSSPVQSESALAQHLCSVLESAFIHGLKVSYFEKESSRSTSKNNLPRPQFWNLIIKISHAETINRVQALTYITSRVGKCRAWLRLILNDGAVTSYLTSILSKDQKTILAHYYDQHSLFLDQEHAEIFLRYLQGVESVVFDLSFNSSMLNQWTKTPLELAGLVPPSTTAPLYLGIQASLENNNYSKSLTDERNSKFRASAPALLLGEYLGSLPSSSGRKHLINRKGSKADEIKHGDMAEAAADADSTSLGSDNTAAVTPTGDDILHKRHLIKKRRRRKKLTTNENGVRIMSSWSSLSSADSLTSGSNKSSRRNSPRSNSFCETPPTTVLTKKENEMTEKMTSAINEEEPAEATMRELGDGMKPTESISTPSKQRKNRNLVLSPKGAEDPVVQQTPGSLEPFPSFPPEEIDGMSARTYPQEGAEDSVSTLEESTGSMSSSHVESKLSSQIPLPNVYKMSYVTSSSSEEDSKRNQGQIDTEGQMRKSTEAIDIYSNSQQDFKSPGSTDLHLNLSTPRGLGNSLSRGGGWSTDQSAANTPEAQRALSRSTSSNVLASAVNQIAEIKFSFEGKERIRRSSSRKFSQTEKISEAKENINEVFIRREGYLKKLGERFKLWKQRWFVLHGTMVHYYKEKNSTEKLGTIDLTDVLSVSEDCEEEGGDVTITMKDGTKHYLAALNRKITLDWAADFRQVMSGHKSPKPLPQKESKQDVINGYLEEYEVISVRNHLLNGTNTSWYASMIAHMGRIANEKGLDSQNYQCADCASPIGIIYGPPRLCSFTGQYYCGQCHSNEEAQIPARIIHNWDFRKHKVSKRSKTFLEQIHTDALISLNESNPGIYKYIDEMGKLLHLRLQLKNLKPYLQTCRNFNLEDIANRLGSRLYFLDDSHLYSVLDLCAVPDKSLGAVVAKIVATGTKHVYGCALCKAKGFLCEICQSDKVIFPFETDTTVQCFECKSVFHRGCKTESVKCPKCERRQRRCLKSVVDLNESTSDSEKGN